MTYTVKSEIMTYKISSLGAELQSAVSKDGFEFIWQGGSVWNGHSPILFPICGRLKDNKYTYGGAEYNMFCHGFFSSSTPSVTEHTDSKIVFSLSDSEQTFKIYPFKFGMTLSYEARGNTLTVRAEIENRGERAMPFMYGAHPAIRVPLDDGLTFEDYKINFGKSKILINSLTPGIPFINPTPRELILAGGEYTLSESDIKEKDTLVLSGLDGMARLYSPRGDRSVEIRFDDGFKYLCLWKMPTPDAKYICIEPWSGIPQDGYTDEVLETRPSMIKLAPCENICFTYTIKFRDTEALS